jgi:hypothetical protein
MICSIDIPLLFSGLSSVDILLLLIGICSVDIYLLFSGIFMPEKQSLRVCQETRLDISDRLNKDEYPCLQQINIYATNMGFSTGVNYATRTV